MMRHAVLGLILLTACTELTGAAYEFPSPAYRQWWDDAASCAGTIADVRRVEWIFVERIDDAPQAAGRWRAPHEITIVTLYRDSKRIVQHEMLHDLLQRGDEAHGHPCFALPHR